MFYNAARQTVKAYYALAGEARATSLCPECQAALIAHRGEIITWHWAHPPGDSTNCPWRGESGGESAWHLRWKQTYATFTEWRVEVGVTIGDSRYVLDAANLPTKRVREFVHSLSPYYLCKYHALRMAGYDVLWIADGGEFSADRTRRLPKGGLKNLLRPRAYGLLHDLKALIHLDDDLYHEWKDNIWYPTRGPTITKLLDVFSYGASVDDCAAAFGAPVVVEEVRGPRPEWYRRGLEVRAVGSPLLHRPWR